MAGIRAQGLWQRMKSRMTYVYTSMVCLTVLCLVAVLIWVYYHKDCADDMTINMKYSLVGEILKLHVNSSNSNIVEKIKTLQFLLPTGYSQRETTIYEKTRVTFIFIQRSSVPDPRVIGALASQVLTRIKTELGLSVKQPELTNETKKICLLNKA